MTSSKFCSRCKQDKDIIFYTSKSGRIRNECKPCAALISKEYRKKNPNKVKTYNQLYFKTINPDYEKNRPTEAKDRRLAKALALRNTKREEFNSNRKLKRDHKAEYEYKKTRRKDIKLRSLKDKYKIETTSFYLNKKDGFTIDHIIPLSSESVCGLHVPWNLQYLSVEHNSLKGKSFDFTQDNRSWERKLFTSLKNNC